MKKIQIQDEYLFVKSTEPYQIGMLIESMRKIAAGFVVDRTPHKRLLTRIVSLIYSHSFTALDTLA